MVIWTTEALFLLSGIDIKNRIMNKILYILFFTFLNAWNVCCQSTSDQRYTLSKEIVKKKESQVSSGARKGVNGIVNGKLVIHGGSEGLTDKFLLFDERTFQVSQYITFFNKSDKVLGVLVKDDKILKSGYMRVPEKYRYYSITDIPVDSFPYQDVWIQRGNATVKIDTYPFHFIDKSYDVSFSSDGQYVIVNPYTDATAGYWPEDDDRFYIYDLVKMNEMEVRKQIIKCERCMKVNMINDKMIFVKEIKIGRGMDGYYKNIYISPKNNINDTLKVAHDINIRLLSPDGKFILGEKYLHGRYVPVIVDVASRRFQYLLGREYPMNYSFYSSVENKFAFDLDTYIIYVEFPVTYPFDALNKDMSMSTKGEDTVFWKKYRHESLK